MSGAYACTQILRFFMSCGVYFHEKGLSGRCLKSKCNHSALNHGKMSNLLFDYLYKNTNNYLFL